MEDSQCPYVVAGMLTLVFGRACAFWPVSDRLEVVSGQWEDVCASRCRGSGVHVRGSCGRAFWWRSHPHVAADNVLSLFNPIQQ